MRGTGIFETATRNLQDRHETGCLRDLSEVSGQYFWVHKKIDKLQQEMAAALPKEFFEKLDDLDSYLAIQEAIANEIYYNQGFADGISLIMQSLLWEAVRR